MDAKPSAPENPPLPSLPSPPWRREGLVLGIALTEHCNLRCPHCIRDDVTTVRSLDAPLVLRTIDEARALTTGPLVVSYTGGEPLLHPDFAMLVDAMAQRGVSWRLTTNGWHYKRLAALVERHPANLVRLSLSGATRATHDHDRGRGSFDRVLQSLALLTSRRIPAGFTLVLDRRSIGELQEAYALATALGVTRLHYILPQPVPGSVARDSDIPPGEWRDIRTTVQALARQSSGTVVQLDYGYPFDGDEITCDSLAGRRVYVDARGQLSTCCQLSEYGTVESDVIGSLHDGGLAYWLPELERRRHELATLQCKRHDPTDPLDPFPCMRCARATGKLEWLRAFPGTPWQQAAWPHALQATT